VPRLRRSHVLCAKWLTANINEAAESVGVPSRYIALFRCRAEIASMLGRDDYSTT
jgi:hypothetical protein